MTILNINVRLKDLENQWTIGHNPFVVDFKLFIGIANFHVDFGFDTTIFWSSSPIELISVFTDFCFMQKLSWASFGVFSIFHVGRARVNIKPRTVYHVFDDYIKQMGISLKIE